MLRIARDIERRGGEIAALLRAVHERSRASDMEPEYKAVFDAALGFGIWNPLALDFGCSDRKAYGPNAMGFQFVLSDSERRLRESNRKDTLSIKADRQSEFNAAQASVHDMLEQVSDVYGALKGNERRRFLEQPFFEGTDAEDALRMNMPAKGIEFVASESSIGLQIVDIYLWLLRRARSGTALSGEIENLGRLVGKRTSVASVSLEGMEAKWNSIRKRLPAFTGPSIHRRI